MKKRYFFVTYTVIYCNGTFTFGHSYIETYETYINMKIFRENVKKELDNKCTEVSVLNIQELNKKDYDLLKA